MAIAKVEVTPVGMLLLFPAVVANYQNNQRSTSRPIAPVPNLAGTPTSELLSLMVALHTSTVKPQTHERESNLTAAVSSKQSVQ